MLQGKLGSSRCFKDYGTTEDGDDKEKSAVRLQKGSATIVEVPLVVFESVGRGQPPVVKGSLRCQVLATTLV